MRPRGRKVKNDSTCGGGTGCRHSTLIHVFAYRGTPHLPCRLAAGAGPRLRGAMADERYWVVHRRTRISIYAEATNHVVRIVRHPNDMPGLADAEARLT